MRLAMGQVVQGLEELKARGSVSGLADQMQTRQELYELLNYSPGQQWNFPSEP